MGPLTLNNADNMLWLGRYTERVYTTLSEFASTYDANVDLETKDFSDFCEAVGMPLDTDKPLDDFLYDLLYDPDNPVSVCSSMRCAFGNAMLLRPYLGTSTTSYIELALINLRESKSDLCRLVRQRSVEDHLLTFWGSIENGHGPLDARALVFVGKYIERLDLFTRLGKPQDYLFAPLAKLAFYLSGVASPSRLPLAQTLGTLADSIESRGYDPRTAQDIRSLCGAQAVA